MDVSLSIFLRLSSWHFFFFSLLTDRCSLASAGPETPAPTPTPSTSSFNKKELSIIVSVCISALLMAFCFLRLWVSKPWKKKRNSLRDEETEKGEKNGSILQHHQTPSLSGVKRLSWEELARITGNFSTVIGQGGFSTVYLAVLSGSDLGAVKLLRSSERLSRVYRQELDVLLRLQHPNIVKLIGYCDEREEGVLLLEFVPNGTLYDRLHARGSESTLSWRQRMAIAIGVARAIEYLHDGCDDAPIIHCDLKSSNVLLHDRCLAPKLCDFGSACLDFSAPLVLPSSRSPAFFGSPGYIDPYYLRTGITCKKTDVYSFGVLLLELLTGAEVFCAETERLLSRGEIASQPARAPELVDPRLAGKFDAEEARAIAFIAVLCLREDPSLRPSMSEVVSLLSEKVPGSVADKLLSGGRAERATVLER